MRLSDRGTEVFEDTYEIGPNRTTFGVPTAEIPARDGRFALQVKPADRARDEWFLPDYADAALGVELRLRGEPPTVTVGYIPAEDCSTGFGTTASDSAQRFTEPRRREAD